MIFVAEDEGARVGHGWEQWQATAALALAFRGRVQLYGSRRWAVTQWLTPQPGRPTLWSEAIQQHLNTAAESGLIEVETSPFGVARLTPAGRLTLSEHLHRALTST